MSIHVRPEYAPKIEFVKRRKTLIQLNILIQDIDARSNVGIVETPKKPLSDKQPSC